MQQYVNKLNETETIKTGVFGKGKFTFMVLDNNISNADQTANYKSEPDFSLEFKQNNKMIMERVNFKTKNTTNMRISSNQTLEFMKGVNFVKFSLVRTKIMFNTYFDTNTEFNTFMELGGELIDVSIPHKDDSGIQHYFDHLDKNVTTYHIKCKNT